jgi:hypothetical protein
VESLLQEIGGDVPRAGDLGSSELGGVQNLNAAAGRGLQRAERGERETERRAGLGERLRVLEQAE